MGITVLDYNGINEKERAFVLGLNKANEELLLPMDADELAFLSNTAALFKIAYVDGVPAGFLIALREEIKEYDVMCYKQFCERYPKFIYIDRVAVDERFRNKGIARRLYQSVFERAKELGIEVLTAAIVKEPYNEASMGFHGEMDFCEIGEVTVRGGTVNVSLQAAMIP